MARAVLVLLLLVAPARADEPAAPPPSETPAPTAPTAPTAPVDTPPPAPPRAPTVLAPAPVPPPSVAVEAAEPAPRPLRKKPLFYIALFGGLGVVAAGVTLGILLGASPRDPVPTLGTARGN